jgi:Tfp pilus assembly protein PilO
MKKYKIAITGLLILFALSAAGCLFSFAYLSVQELSRLSRLGKQAAFKLQEKELQKQSQEHRDWQNLPQELRKFRREYIINMDDFAVLRRDLNACLAANQLKVRNISSQFGAGKGKTRRVTLGFAVEGSYRDLKKFIYDMEQKPKLHFFERIEMNGSAELVRGKFTMEAYIGE